jgi:SAM-dependent methyltransferase
MELYVVAVLMVACVILALWLLARRIRTWKEQILHAVSIVESNSAIAHKATRAELAQQLASLDKQVDELSMQTKLGRLARASLDPPRLVADSRPPSARFDDALAFLRSLKIGGDDPEGGRSYLELHLRRLARTLDLTPTPGSTRRALELGAYMQITPALACLLGYEEVRGAYLGQAGQSPLKKTVPIGDKQVFTCDVDLFDAEKDPFPYPDGHFDVVLACEILEHLRFDPMHMLLESRRVLAPDGALVLTTPNTASFTSVARALIGEVNPQIYSHYPTDDADVPHVREYTPVEVHDLLFSAGFSVEWLFTERGGIPTADIWIGPLLDYLGFPTNLRGEQIYVVARKRLGGNVIRRPEFLYGQPWDYPISARHSSNRSETGSVVRDAQ